MAQVMRKPQFTPSMGMEKTSPSPELLDIIREISWSDVTQVLFGFGAIYLMVVFVGIWG